MIKRSPIRDQIYEHLLEGIVGGDFRPGDRIKDSELAAEFDVSRTPVRETLLRLQLEGLLDNRPGRGFTVRPLDAKEIHDCYPVLWTLESLALSFAVPFQVPVLDELEQLNQRLKRESLHALSRIETDAAWHQKLVSACGNDRLLEMTGQLRMIVRRFEIAYMQHSERVAESATDHEAIIEALRAGETERAQVFLREHWRRSLDLMVAALDS